MPAHLCALPAYEVSAQHLQQQQWRNRKRGAKRGGQSVSSQSARQPVSEQLYWCGWYRVGRTFSPGYSAAWPGESQLRYRGKVRGVRKGMRCECGERASTIGDAFSFFNCKTQWYKVGDLRHVISDGYIRLPRLVMCCSCVAPRSASCSV